SFFGVRSLTKEKNAERFRKGEKSYLFEDSRLETKSRHARTRDGSLQIAVACGATAKGLSQREGGAAYNLAVDDDVHAIGAGSQRARAQIVYVLTASNPEVRAGVGGTGVNRFVDLLVSSCARSVHSDRRERQIACR